jgi:flagellar motor switch protein FliG
MIAETPEDRIAVLLTSLGLNASDPAFDSLPADPMNRVKRLMEEYQNDPADDDEVEEVLNEFLRMLRFAKKNAPKLAVHHPDDDHDNQIEDEPEVEPEPEPAREFKATDDAFADLNRLKPIQIAGALRTEQPRTAALVLSCLSPSKAGESLQNFPDELQNEVFLLLRNPPTAPKVLLERIVRATVTKGCLLGDEAICDPEEESYRKLAEVLRAMSQMQRGRILEGLATSDPEAIERIRKMLFVFDDVVRLGDRCVQKILAEVDSMTLTKALKNAEPEYLDKFAKNLSKRARATLLEEIEFMGSVKPNEEEEARNAVCNVMSELDQRGDLEFV